MRAQPEALGRAIQPWEGTRPRGRFRGWKLEEPIIPEVVWSEWRGTTGLKPAAFAVTVLCRRKHPATTNERERLVAVVFLRVRTLFPPPRLIPNDTTRERPTWAGIGGLRHKPRHKAPHSFLGCSRQIDRGWARPFDASSHGRGRQRLSRIATSKPPVPREGLQTYSK